MLYSGRYIMLKGVMSSLRTGNENNKKKMNSELFFYHDNLTASLTVNSIII